MPELDVQDLYRRYGGVISCRCQRILKNKAAAEDAAQETFLRVHRHLRSAPPTEEALRWIYRIATNYCLNELRRERTQGRRADDAPEVSDHRFGEDRFADRDLLRRLVTLAPAHLGETAWLYHVDDLDQSEVAEVLGVSRRSVVTYLRQFREFALRYLRQS